MYQMTESHPGYPPPGPRPRWRSAPTLIALGLVLLLIAGIAGVAIGRSTAPDSSTSDVPPLKVSAATLGTPHGPSKLVNGMPVGFTDDQAGALGATACAVESLIDLVQSRRAIPVPLWQQTYLSGKPSDATLLKIYNWNLITDGTPPGGRATGFPPGPRAAERSVQNVVPIGYQMLSFTPGAVHLKLWTNALGWLQGSTAAQPSLVRYDTADVRLVWSSGDWKITSLTRAAGTPVLGPEPGDPGSEGYVPWPGGQYTFVTG